MATENGTIQLINLRQGGAVKLLFPENINTSDRANWESADVAGGLKPLSFANSEPQKIRFDEILLDNTRTDRINQSVEQTIEKLRTWMRPAQGDGAQAELQIITAGWKQKCVLSSLEVKRGSFTKAGVCLRAYLSLEFDELKDDNRNIGGTNVAVGGGNSISGRRTP